MVTRGRKPTPTVLRVLEGNRSNTPLPKNEPQIPVGMPEPPGFLHAYAVEEWVLVSTTLYEVGVLTEVDRAALAAYCQAFARWRVAEECLAVMAKTDPLTHGIMMKTASGNAIENPVYSAAKSALRDMLRAAAEFGMTPSARARIEGKSGEQADPIASKYFKKRG